MTDKIGVLGETTTVTAATTTVYTVPTGKAARGKIFFRGASGINSTLAITINGVIIFATGALNTGEVVFSTNDQMRALVTGATLVVGTSLATTPAPAPQVYFLSAGDTVTITIGTADFASISVQFVGTEIDV